jgi:cyanophycinase
MMSPDAPRLLFLVGGTDDGILDLVAAEFVPAAGGTKARIALLLIGGEGWEAYVARYVAPWEGRGVRRVEVIVPREDGRLDLPAAEAQLREATGIFIGGGRTATYHELYASEPIRSLIRERYCEGVPVAGLSAGALIAPEACLLRPSPKNPDQPFRIVEGLELVRDLIVEVHFAEHVAPGSPTYTTLASLLEGMAQTRTARGLGIGPAACAVLRDGRLAKVVGRGVREVAMTDFERREYAMSDAHPVRL